MQNKKLLVLAIGAAFAIPCAHAQRAAAAKAAEDVPDSVVELYGKDQGAKIQHAEAFELCEYGAQPRPAELRRLFPVHAKQETLESR